MGRDLARAGLVVAGLLIMLLLGWIPFVGWFLLLPIGFIIFIYGLVARSDLEMAALTRPPVVITQPPVTSPHPSLQVSGKYCGNCGRFNPVEASFCHACGRPFEREAGGITG